MRCEISPVLYQYLLCCPWYNRAKGLGVLGWVSEQSKREQAPG